MNFYGLNVITVPMFTLIFHIIFCLCSEFVLITADIRIIQFLRDPEALVSSNNNFKLGFFSPGNSTNRYFGIWYNLKDTDNLEVVWVANRDNPLNDTSGVLKVSDDGNLQLLNGLNKLVWSTNVSNIANGSSAQLLDYGNLVLHANGNGSIIWQSFENPTDSLLPPVKFLLNEQVHLSSWKSLSDPTSGNFTYGIYHYELPELAIRNGDKTYWRSGPWNGYLFLGVPYIYEDIATGFSIRKNHDGELEISYSISNQSSLQHFVLSYDGQLLKKDWSDDSKKWTIGWQSMESKCDIYGMCGPFGICNPRNSPICACLNGFKPKNDEEWMIGNWTSGCVRKTPLQCGAKDGFLRLKHVKVPDNAVWLIADEDNFQLKCLGNCLCLAYAYYSGIGCMTWTEKLVDVQQFSSDGADLFIRLPHSELGKSRKWITILVVVVIIGVVILGFSSYCLWRWIAPRYGKRLKRKKKLLRNMFGVKGSGLELDLPLFELEMLEAATNKFDHRKKLGSGGFGPVYKGKLQDGQEVAVKRLSSASGQGQQEFMNEVVVISKLQHRNLVKLLGCCVDGEEKLLVYEFMPNKSLDVLLFDETRKKLLDWEKRYNIIKGVCRGVLYLHRDSRLRIIHRDLKASNILLDEELNPKISDFGMARIFGGKEDKANTLRVVGTYGYMSPEYAMQGRFSEKSDVYSFGVLLLEIVSGQRNSSFNKDESLSLIGYAWKLWNEDNMVPFMDSTICSPSLEEEILKCIHVGLLCVEEIPEDRPTMSRVISMFENEAADLARPVQPGFPQRRISQGIDVSQDGEHCSVALLDSLTVLSGR